MTAYSTSREADPARAYGVPPALAIPKYTQSQIAEALVIAEGTAANHVNHILDKMGFSSRAQVAAWVTQHGLLA